MVIVSTCVFRLYLFGVVSDQLLVELRGSGLIIPSSIILSDLEVADSPSEITLMSHK